jgi:hypothetical protein
MLILRKLMPPAAALLIVAIATTARTDGDQPASQPVKTGEQRLSDALRTVINKGADLYNVPIRDQNGCYRLFQGALMTARVQLDSYPALQKEIDMALAEAERQGSDGQRAFTLRRTLDLIRSTLGQKVKSDADKPATPAKQPEKKPTDG